MINNRQLGNVNIISVQKPFVWQSCYTAQWKQVEVQCDNIASCIIPLLCEAFNDNYKNMIKQQFLYKKLSSPLNLFLKALTKASLLNNY